MKKFLVVVAILAFIVASVVWFVPWMASRVDYPPLKYGDASIVYGADGKTEIGRIKPPETGQTLKDEEISPLLRITAMAAEDRSFYEHQAVSWGGIIRAAWSNIVGSADAGGSTISEQYVKNAYLSREKSLERRGKSAFFAHKLEGEFTKDQILTKYWNSSYLGRGVYGVEDASQVWFGHSAKEINDPKNPMHVAKATFLVAMLQRPTPFSEYVNGQPDQLKRISQIVARQKYALAGIKDVALDKPERMVKEKDRPSREVTEAAAKLLPLHVTKTVRLPDTGSTDPYLLDYIKEWLGAIETDAAKELDPALNDADAAERGQSAAEAMLARGGLKIYTTIDPGVQKLTTDAVRNNKVLMGQGLSVGGFVLNPKTGGVVAMYGGHNYAKDSLNYALYANRQVGSTMKAVVLADAVQKGISPMSEFMAPANIGLQKGQQPIWNFSKKPGSDSCRMTLADAIAASNNPVHIELIMGKMAADCREATAANPTTLVPFDNHGVSPKSVAELARKMGADDSLVPGRNNPPKLDEVPTLALGTSSLNTLQLGSIGATLANNGEHIKPYLIEKIETSDGQTSFEHEEESSRALKEEHVEIVNQTLTGVYTKGTASGARVDKQPLAGKSGSTDTDALMLAFNSPDSDKRFVCSMWTGYKDNRPIRAGSGEVAKVCQAIFAGALKGVKGKDFPKADLNSGDKVGVKANAPAPPPPPATTESKPQPTTPQPTPKATPSATKASPSSVVPPPSQGSEVPPTEPSKPVPPSTPQGEPTG